MIHADIITPVTAFVICLLLCVISYCFTASLIQSFNDTEWPSLYCVVVNKLYAVIVTTIRLRLDGHSTANQRS